MFRDVEQNAPEWEALRIGRVTSSNNATFMANDGGPFGEPAKKYALKIALERATGRKAEFSFSNADMERGHAQEPVARMLYEQEQFCEVSNGGFFDHGLHGGSPDGLIGADGMLEIKSVQAHVHYANIKRGTFDPAYRWQLVGHLECSGRSWVDFVSYCSDFPEDKQLYIYRVTRESVVSEIDRLKSRRDEFLALIETIYNEVKESE